jgi:hypothetical protein
VQDLDKIQINNQQTHVNRKRLERNSFFLSLKFILFSSRSGGNQIAETEGRQGKSSSTKNPREETAAQLAQAAAAHVQNRQGNAGVPTQQQVSGPPPPPVSQAVRPQLPNQQQQQHQFLYQQGVLPPQPQQIRGPPPPRLPPAGNVRYPGDPYQQQQQQQQQQRPIPNQNYNQSNNNELSDDDEDADDYYEQEERSRSAEKILDAFEYYYVNHGKPTTVPMKVKFIPEENNSNNNTQFNYHHHQQQNTNNNNNRYRSTSRPSCINSSSVESIYSYSPLFSRRSLYNHHQTSVNKLPFFS